MDEEFWSFTPVARQIFLYLMMRVNYVDGSNGYKRGQGFFSYGKIKEALSWYVGFRKHTYSDSQIRNAMNHLVTNKMIITTKSTRGLRVTICKYDSYQNPKYYEHHNEQHNEKHNDQHNERAPKDTLYVKERKNNTKTKEEEIDSRFKEEVIDTLNKTTLTSEDLKITVGKSSEKEKKEWLENKESLGGQLRRLRELAGGWLRFQPESELYLIKKVIKDIGYEMVAKTTEEYAKKVNSGELKDNIVSSSRYWWSTGVYSWANKISTTNKKVEKVDQLVKRKCNACHNVFEYNKDKIPQICTGCNNGMLLSQVEYNAEFPPNPKPKPEPEVLNEDEQSQKDKVDAFLNAFGGSR